MKRSPKKWGLAHEITYEVPTASGNAVWHVCTAYGLQKLDRLALCKLHGYRVIRIRSTVYSKYC